jgi:hypothetical protein
VEELLARISAHELAEWQAYEEISGPIGDERLDKLFAMLASIIANSNRAKRAKPYTAEQFIPKWDAGARPERKPEMNGEEMLRAVKRYNRTMGG